MLNHLIKLKENDLSKDILVPLFKHMYGARVEFTGGGPEKGRDIVIYRKDPLGFDDFIGIQVKKIKATPNSSTNSFQQLLTQLEQLKNEKVVDQLSGKKIRFRQLYFVTPYTIFDRAYDTHHGAYESIIEQGITIIDGPRLEILIRKHTPFLVSSIIGADNFIENQIKPRLTNKELMTALNFSTVKNICDIYCDSSFIAGNKQNGDLFNKYYMPNKSPEIEINFSEVDKLDKYNNIIINALDTELVSSETLNYSKREFSSLKASESQKIKLQARSTSLRSQIINITSLSKFRDFYPTQTSSVDFKYFLDKGYEEAKITSDKLEFYKEVAEVDSLYKERDIVLKDIKHISDKIEKFQRKFKVEVKSEQVSNKLNHKITSLASLTKNANDKLLEYLKLSHDIEQSLIVLNQFPEQFSSISKEDNITIKPHKINLDRVFDSGLNIIVLGEAGSGKTTNLQVYAHKLYKSKTNDLVIYMTLEQLSKFSTQNSSADITNGIFQYLSSLGSSLFTLTELQKELKGKKVILILDSIDEAIASYSWIIDKLALFSEEFPKCQIITSSRYTVQKIKSLKFISVSLLPFSDSQKKDFFSKWFNDDDAKSIKIIEHLGNHPKLNAIITNPLSATIMATLQEGDVPLPNTESSLYRKRFELLSGLFDKFKGINRLRIQPEELLKYARHIAFVMQKNRKRAYSKEALISLLNQKVNNEEFASELINELISPAEILLINPENKYSFGHLRFQEYLASEQLILERTFNISKHMHTAWWHDVFLLYSQHAHDINWIIQDAAMNAYTTRVRALLSAMVSNRPSSEQATLFKRIEIALADERIY